MKKNALTITLVLCFMISITLMVVPASAQLEIYCDGTEEVTLIDEPGLEFTMSCKGESLWEMYIEDLYIGELGEVGLFYWIYGEDAGEDVIVEEGQMVLSPILLTREVKTQVLTGDKLEVQFKFKPMP